MKLDIMILALAASALALSSCSVVNKATGRHPKTMTVTSGSGTVTVDGVPSGSPISTPPSQALSKGTPRQPTADELTGGRWVIASVGSTTVEAEDDAPYLEFDRKGRFYGSNGCNIINGDYVVRADGVMTFGSVLSTMKLCPDDRYGDLINSVINDNSRLVAECRRIGQDTYLSLMDSAGKTKMTLRRHNMEFLNGNWQVTAIDGKEINDPEANIFFDIAELKVHGNTGCNYFNGDLYIDPMRSNAIDLSNMGTTRMACPKTSQETAMLAALESAASAIAGTAEGTALLLDSSGKQVLTLKRIPTQDE